MMLPIVAAVLILGGVAVWWFTRPPETPPGEVLGTNDTPPGPDTIGAPPGTPPGDTNPTPAAVEDLGVVAAVTEDAGTTAVAVVAPENPTNVAPTEAQVRIESTPDGAHVLVAQTDRGVTPLSLTLPVGAATSVTLQLPGYTALTRDITARTGTNSPVRVTLQSLPYAIDVETTPAGARVAGGGRTIVSPGTLSFARPRGPVSVVASRNGFNNATRTVTLPEFVETNGTMHATVSLTLTQRTTTVHVRPPGGGDTTPPDTTPPDTTPPDTTPPPPDPPHPPDALPDNPFG